MKYWQDQGLTDKAQIVRLSHHSPRLDDIFISYVFRETAARTGEKVKAGVALRVDDRNWLLHKTDVIIEIAHDIYSEANSQFRNAILDHELCHVIVFRDENEELVIESSGRKKIRMRHHDVEEFEEILTRHGTYHAALRSFVRTFASLTEEDNLSIKAVTAG